MMVIFNFELFLTSLVVISGLLSLIDLVILAPRRKADSIPWVMHQARGFFPVLLLVWLIRSFLVQPYRVPSGSLEPTIMPGEFIVVKQYAYGLRLPVTHTKLWPVGDPQRGDIVLFRWPKNPAIVFIKRVIGLPGDHIVYKRKQLYINGKLATQDRLRPDQNFIPDQAPQSVWRKLEHLGKLTHDIFIQPRAFFAASGEWDVPAGHYFMMGDNRDDSNDSRYWGFVPDANIIGQATYIWMSWDGNHHTVRWHRLGKRIQ